MKTGRLARATAWTGPRLPAILVVVIVTVISIITMAISYAHEYELARDNAQLRWVAALIPFSVDGMLLVASIALYWAGRHGVRRPWRPITVGAVGILATIAANMFSDLHFRWLGPAVAASSGVALVLITWVAFWLVALQRALAAGDTAQLGVNCACPPPATSLAGAVLRAREVLRAAGEPHGQEILARRFGVTVHEVRKILAPPVDEALALTNGAGHGPAD